jgi:hypothetical protein
LTGFGGKDPVAASLTEKRSCFAALLCGGLSLGLPAAAQDTVPMGTVLTFGIGERLQYSDNLDLTPVSLGATTEAITYLNFGMIKSTDTSVFTLDARVELLFASAPPGSDAANGLNNPFLGVTYQTSSASSVFDFNASLQQTTLNQIRDVTDFDTGSGVRGNALIGASIGWGQDAPFGFGLSAAYEDITYTDTSDPSLTDAQRLDLGANASLALSPVSQLTLGVIRSNFEEQGASSADLQTDTTAGLVIQRANGDTASANVFVTNTETGSREGLSAQYQMALPNGSLQFTPGLTRATTGKVYWTSDFEWQQSLPSGSFSAAWNQGVTSQNENDEEVLLSGVSLGYTHDVNPLNSFTLNLDWAQQVYTVSGDTSTNTSFEAVWSRTITQDWNLDLGYLYRQSDKATADSAQSNTVYLQLNRDFNTRY